MPTVPETLLPLPQPTREFENAVPTKEEILMAAQAMKSVGRLGHQGTGTYNERGQYDTPYQYLGRNLMQTRVPIEKMRPSENVEIRSGAEALETFTRKLMPLKETK